MTHDDHDQEMQTFWSFALRVYGAPGVREECLALQDLHGVDVNVLLYVAFLAVARGKTVTAGDCAALIAASDPWRRAVTEPLRALRRNMKQRAEADPRLAFVHESLKRTELDSERAQHLLLIDALPVQAGTSGGDPESALATCLRAFGIRSPRMPERLLAALRRPA